MNPTQHPRSKHYKALETQMEESPFSAEEDILLRNTTNIITTLNIITSIFRITSLTTINFSIITILNIITIIFMITILTTINFSKLLLLLLDSFPFPAELQLEDILLRNPTSILSDY